MNQKKKIAVISLLFLLVLTSFTLLVSATDYIRLCLTRGQSIPNEENPIYSCDHDLCITCVNASYYPAAPYRCYSLPGECQYLDSSIDLSPPNLTINSPEQNGLYTSRSVLIDLTTNEEADVYYLNNLDGRGRWIRVCQDCLIYSHSRSFKDGLNDITFRAVDVIGNEVLVNRQFLIDSRKPQIHKSEPRNGYASGLFEIQYTEKNLKNITINYGNYLTGFQQAELIGCVSGTKQWCSINLDLSIYNGQEISYYFRVEDVAGNFKESQPKNLDVDTVFPVLNNNPHFWAQGEGRHSRYIYFTFNVTEENFDEIEYIDWTDNNPRWRRLCSRLDENGICEKRKSFRRGFHSLDIQITDEAGNAISTPRVEFEVV